MLMAAEIAAAAAAAEGTVGEVEKEGGAVAVAVAAATDRGVTGAEASVAGESNPMSRADNGVLALAFAMLLLLLLALMLLFRPCGSSFRWSKACP